MPWLNLFFLILPIAGIVALLRRLHKYGPGQLMNPNPSIPDDESAPLSHHVIDPEHPEDKDWASSEPDPDAP